MKQFIKSVIRNFLKNPATNLINLIGLTLSLILVIFLSAYCYSELTTDKFQQNGKRVYLYLPSEDRVYTPGVLKENIDSKVPGIESSVRIGGTWEAPVFQTENGEPITSDLLFADKDFFKLFTFEVVAGDPASALQEPMSIVITESLSRKLFGNEGSIGKIIRLNDSRDLTVRGVIREPAGNSCLRFSSVTSMLTQKIVQGEEGEFTEWGWCDFQTFVLLQNNVSADETEKKILDLFPADFRKDYSDAKLTALSDVYFSKFMLYGNDYLVSGDRKKVIILLMVALTVLAIALVNFFNISSSQWLARIRQAGILKILGARRSAILFGLLSESLIYFLIALFLAMDLLNLLAPVLSGYTGIYFNPELVFSFRAILAATTGILLISLIFSILPALRISSSKAIDNINNNVKSKPGRITSKSLLVTLQFTIAIVLIAFTLLVQKQIRFGRINPGMNYRNIIGIKMTPQLDQKKDVLRNMLYANSSVAKVSFTQYYPGKDISEWGIQMDINGEKKQLDFDTFNADAAFFEITGLDLVSGRFYTDDLSTDKEKVIVNQAFLQKYEISDPLGRRFAMGKRNFEITGVLRDFHFQPFSQPIAPLVIRNESSASVCLASLEKINPGSLPGVINEIRKGVSQLSPAFPAEISFFDQAIGSMYDSEMRFQRTFSLFAVCAIVISCLGILALALFSGQQRIKEIGIRKINGASTPQLMVLLNKDLIRLVAIAFIAGTPVALFLSKNWLQNFAYRTELSWWVFALAGLIALAIALLTVSLQSWRAARGNPVNALRYE